MGEFMKKSVIITISFFFIQGVIHNIGHPITPSFVRALGIPEFMFGVFFCVYELWSHDRWSNLGCFGR